MRVRAPHSIPNGRSPQAPTESGAPSVKAAPSRRQSQRPAEQPTGTATHLTLCARPSFIAPSRRSVPGRTTSASPHPSSCEGHHSTAWWSSSFLLLDLIPHGFHAAAAVCSRLQRNSVPSTHMRCRITASRRANATIAFFIPRRLAICMAQALSHDHFFERNMLCAAS
jgi:hypothetical protein